MGVLSGKDIYSAKYMTADITDSANRVIYVPIRYVIGDYFLTDIDHKLFCFKIEGSRIYTWRHKGVRSFRKVYYNTEHYKPLSPPDLKQLSDLITKNHLPRLNMRLHRILKTLGERENSEAFVAHSIPLFLEELSKHYEEGSEEFLNIQRYLNMLHIEQIVTPVKRVSEYIQEDLITPDPKFFGDVFATLQRLDGENRKITNSPVSGKMPWMKWALILTLVGAIIGMAWWAYDSGAFSSLPGLPSLTPPGPSVADLVEKYPTPEAMKAAIDRGELSYDSLPKEMQSAVDDVKLPVLAPNP